MTFRRTYQLAKNIYHLLQAHLWRIVYGLPDRGLHLYGVTGTNGKTTTCYLLSSILEQQYSAEAVGMLTTVGLRVGSTLEVNKTKLTTLPSRLVFAYLKKMKRSGVTHVVLEMTSHALDQNRLSGICLDGAIILNVAREHLNYHSTMEEYARAKERIVGYLKVGAPLVGKEDDAYVGPMLGRAKNKGVRTFSFTTQSTQATPTALSGQVNKENATAAKLLMQAVGISDSIIEKGLQALVHVPGRMEWIEAPQGFRVLIDYAVTPDALERLYIDVKAEAQGRALALLGAAGLRDRGKRPDMARIVAQYADELIITREDPWTESEEQIFSDLEQGLTEAALPWQRIVDRREALQYLLKNAKAGDVVVVTGKGAEEGMGIGKDIVPWNDRQVIEELLQTL
ncbi:MAG: Mur ligase family protein [Candidatus Andersenbacteria bacterium]